MNHSHHIQRSSLMAWVASQNWLLHRPVAETMRAVVLRHAAGVKLEADEIELHAAKGRERARSLHRRGAAAATRGMSLDPEHDELWYLDGPENSVAVVPVTGLLCAYSSMVNGMSLPDGRTPGDIEYALSRAVEAALRPGGTMGGVGGIRNIVLKIDSPGGTVAGGHDMCESVERARAALLEAGSGASVVAYAHNTCCSGGYLLASQCDAVFASEQAVVGSIGVCGCLYDESEMYGDMGVRAILVASGPQKGAGVYPGAEVNAEHVASCQAEIDSLADWFIARVAEGRKMDVGQVQALATGATWVGERAQAAGLVDGVIGWNELLNQLAE